MHNSFLACVLSYHNLKRENTSTISHSEIMWPKVYLIPLLPQKRNSLVKGLGCACAWDTEVSIYHAAAPTPAALPAARRLEPQTHSCPQASSATGQDSTSPPDPASALLWLLIHSSCRKSCKAHAGWWAIKAPRDGISVDRGKHTAEPWMLCKTVLRSWFTTGKPS